MKRMSGFLGEDDGPDGMGVLLEHGNFILLRLATLVGKTEPTSTSFIMAQIKLALAEVESPAAPSPLTWTCR